MKLDITGIGSELQGVGRWADGRAAFVPGALPGETVEAELVRQSERFVEARLVRVLTPAACRKESDCPHDGFCGGCVARHMTYQATLDYKREAVRAALERIGGFEAPDVRPVIGMEQPFAYRNKAEYAVVPDAEDWARVGFRGENQAVCDAQGCLIQHPDSLTCARVVREWMRDHTIPAFDGKKGCVRGLVTRVNAQGELMAVVVTQGHTLPHVPDLIARLQQAAPGLRSLFQVESAPRPTHALDGAARWLWGERTLEDSLLGLKFDLAPQAFFQVNRTQAERLYEQALTAAALTGGETVLDAYCGAGTISLCMARQAKKVIGVEIVPQAVINARDNARKNGLKNTEFIEGDAPRVIAQLVKSGTRAQVICVDPPRKGVDARLIDAILQAAPQRVVYVSCNPATLARDLKKLCAGYRLEYVQPVDLFCWSGHVETVCQLVLRKPAVHINIDVDVDELVQDKRGAATYGQIKDYVLEHSGLKVSSLYIAQVKQKCGIIERENYNKSKSENAKQPQCPPEKEKAIVDALQYFGVI